ncbi:hypothetical protein SAMN04488026_1002181 [Aliiruegeria lutimaris]|uniref:Uncharacterized protein n=1 Tax=Aliiruegeria lutimaris TaxID=571298 RepID=A0A1G8K9A9_9RHOB|nr:hypothetical protein SAMN04488026_1002181 [Aliiruegeria lutimaris]
MAPVPIHPEGSDCPQFLQMDRHLVWRFAVLFCLSFWTGIVVLVLN